jgi:hypothetical protein
MAISRKPKTERAEKKVDIDALINKGGSVAHQEAASEKEAVAVILRVPAGILKRVDAAVSSRVIKTPRNTWILEALLEKLEKESI